MNNKQDKADAAWVRKIIEQELTPQGDLLPPWKKYPEIKRYSIGWRMGKGEVYMIAWREWSHEMGKDQKIDYFKKYSPIPLEWLDWLAYLFGNKEIVDEMFTGDGEFAGIRCLEQYGLADFSMFQTWYKEERANNRMPTISKQG